MKVYDCITFLNEEELLELRLNILNKYKLEYKITPIKFHNISNLILTNEKILNYFKI